MANLLAKRLNWAIGSSLGKRPTNANSYNSLFRGIKVRLLKRFMRDLGLFIEMFRPLALQTGILRLASKALVTAQLARSHAKSSFVWSAKKVIATLVRVFLALLSLVNSTYEMTCKDTSLDAV